MIKKLAELYKVIAHSPDMDSREAIKRIAYINPKKTGGDSNCDNIEFAQYCFTHREYIKSQICQIEHNFIVCLGSFSVIVKCVLCGLDPSDRKPWKKANIRKEVTNGYEYRCHMPGDIPFKIMFNMYHPSAAITGGYINNFQNNYEKVMLECRDLIL